ncbi:MAG: translocation/assembly module TamB domain-containing protein, partial [Candidatus Saganbacteria bacterium]|nr:translocation/assembly module TamB domain-containing protein [Candidatus Saganbacteria bacterium]
NFEELYLPNILSFRSDDSLTLYLSDGEESKLPPFFLSAFKSIEEEITEERKRKTPKFIQNVKGKFTAAGSLTGSGKDLKGSLDLKINSGIIEGYGFEELRASIDSTGKNITINSFSLIKKGGVIEAKGNIDIENKIALEVSSNDFPIDFLSKLVPGKEFEGKLDIKSEIGGTISTPEGSIAFNIGSAKADGISFDEIAGSASLVNSIFSISAEANSKGEKSMIFGNVALAGKKNMDLTASLKGEGMGLFTVFFRQLRHVHGEGEMNLRATGTLDDPQIDGKISLSDLDLYMINLRSGVYNISGNIDVKNSIAKTEGLTAVWVGEFTGMNNNDVEIKGTISLASIFKKERYIGADLAVKDNKYHIEEKAFYKGEASVKDLKLFGPVYFKETDAPEIAKLSGTIDLNDGSISLTKAGRKRAHLPIALDLTVNFGENVVVVGGEAENLISSDISNITINFEAAAEGLQLTGTWSKPDLAGDIVFGRGNIIILDREFRLLSQDEQKRYFGLNSDKIDPNHAAFSGKGTSPYINLASRTKIEVYETSPETKETKIKYVIIVARTSGTQAAPKPEDQLKTTFTSFDTDQTGAKISPASYTEDEVKLMLLPEFIKASAEDATKDKVASRGFLVEYLNSRLQMLLLRQVEKKLEQTLGLESFMLEYNFGKDLERLLPAEEVPNEPGAQKETFAVSFVKRIFDRLYIDVRYAEAMDEVKGENITYFNYELTYKLGYIWSIVYFSEPFTTAWSGYPYYKITLQGEILL